jgi:Zn-dependent peptidase ImmA (M78 family)
VNVKLENIEYRRKFTKRSSTDDAIVIERAVDVFERYFELEDLLQLNEKHEYFVFDRLVLTVEDAEEAAAELRNVWKLGNDPIPDVVELLEDKGYMVVDIDAPEGFDGMKATVGDRMVIVLKKALDVQLDDNVRKRFTALHELAHHVLKFPNDLRYKDRELLCHIFASAVLYPADMAHKELLGARFHFFERELIILKERWGISFLAIFHRANHLGILNDSVLRKLNMGFKKRGYHLYNAEPGRYRSREVPNRMERLVFLGLAKEVLTINEAAFIAGMGAWKFREQMQLLI